MYNNDINEYFRQCRQIKKTFYTSFFKFCFTQERDFSVYVKEKARNNVVRRVIGNFWNHFVPSHCHLMSNLEVVRIRFWNELMFLMSNDDAWTTFTSISLPLLFRMTECYDQKDCSYKVRVRNITNIEKEDKIDSNASLRLSKSLRNGRGMGSRRSYCSWQWSRLRVREESIR